MLQNVWTQASNHFFGPGNPGLLFKKLMKVFNLCDWVLKSIIYRAENALKPESHSSSQCLTDRKNVVQLAVKLDHVEAQKLQAAPEKQQKQDMPNFLAPLPLALDAP